MSWNVSGIEQESLMELKAKMDTCIQIQNDSKNELKIITRGRDHMWNIDRTVFGNWGRDIKLDNICD